MLAPQTGQMAIQPSGPNTYAVQMHEDWIGGTVAIGSALAAQIYHVAQTHCANDAKLKATNQFDIHNLHVEFLRPGMVTESSVVVEVLKYGPLTCHLQLRLYQDDKLRVMASATTTNFDAAIGPSARSSWSQAMLSRPVPDFATMKAGHEDSHRWLPIQSNNEFSPFFNTWLYVHGYEQRDMEPSNSFHSWLANRDGSFFDSVALLMAQDCLPCLHDGMLDNGAPFSIQNFFSRARNSYNSGDRPAIVNTGAKDMMKLRFVQFHVSMDFTFKKRMPAEGLEWLLLNAESKQLDKGRMDIDVETFDEKKELLCLSRQSLVIVDMARRLQKKSNEAAL